jgi:hypothetical protein
VSSQSLIAIITITGLVTNAPFSTINSNNVIIGDPLPLAFTEVNNDFIYVESQISPAFLSPSNSWPTVWNTVTNSLPPGICANFVNSNGVGEYKIWNNAGTFIVTPQ